MTIMYLVASVPSLGAHKLAWIIGSSADPADDIARFGQAVGNPAMFERVLSGEVVPCASMAAEIQLWSMGTIQRRDWRRPAYRWWFERPIGWFNARVHQAA